MLLPNYLLSNLRATEWLTGWHCVGTASRTSELDADCCAGGSRCVAQPNGSLCTHLSHCRDAGFVREGVPDGLGKCSSLTMAVA